VGTELVDVLAALLGLLLGRSSPLGWARRRLAAANAAVPLISRTYEITFK